MTSSSESTVQPLFDALDECVRAEFTAIAAEYQLGDVQAAIDEFETDPDMELLSDTYERALSHWRSIDLRMDGFAKSLALIRFVSSESDGADGGPLTDPLLSDEFEAKFAEVTRILGELNQGEGHVQLYEELLLNRADAERALASSRSAMEQFEAMFHDADSELRNLTRRRRKRLGDRLRPSVRGELLEFQGKLALMMRRQQDVIHQSLRKGMLDECLRLIRDASSQTMVALEAGSSPIAHRVFRIGDSTMSVFAGSITHSSADIVVSSDDSLLTMAGGVSQAIQSAAGVEIVRDASKMVPRAMGDVVVTTAGRMRNRYVVHAVTMKVGGNVPDLPRGLMVRQLCQRVMALLPDLGCRSVAFPALGAGLAGIPYEEVATEMAEALLDAVLLADTTVDVELYLRETPDGSGVETFVAAFERVALERFGLTSLPEETGATLINLTPFAVQGAANAQAADRRQREVMETLRDLDAQRSRIEAQILELTSEEGESLTQGLRALTIRLEALAEIRQMYESELNRVASASSAGEGSVFVSSTSKDLREHRTAVRGVVDRLQLKFVGMEDFEANALAPADLIRNKVMESEIYLGILGMRYGYVDEASGLSMTELEYRQAIASDKDIRMFVMDEDAPITASMVERDPGQLQQLNEFRDRVLKSHSCNLFQTPVDLAAKVERTLSNDG